MWGPDPAGVFKVRNQFRFQILLLAPHPGVVQTALSGRMESITRDIPAEVVADVDPVNLV